jgi:hypothetical protein|tara:strand:+ start:74 stop:520 length:447 start_codon:yes stop_codon:yes gene_type:complete
VNKTIATLAIVFSLAIPQHCLARDTLYDIALDEALNSLEARTAIDSSIQLYFGDRPHSKVLRDFGEFSTNKKTNAFGKSDVTACRWVFLSAIISLQQRVIREGGNAVINIKSNYRGRETVSDSTIKCGAGAIMAGVALKGTVVTLKDE